MRYAILSDIHSNLDALQAVLLDAGDRGGFDEIWCLGDVVGYGPDPVDCIRLLRRYPHICIAGNHDWAAIDKVDTSDFNPDAAAAAHWTSGQLGPVEIEYLETLPLTLQRDDFTLVHGSPREPIWEYVLSVSTAAANFACFDTRFCLIGHSHAPIVFQLGPDGVCRYGKLPGELPLGQQEGRLIINCGGVGQPRDGDPRASYAILDTGPGIVYHYRVEYDIHATQRKMIGVGLPQHLIDRLSLGW